MDIRKFDRPFNYRVATALTILHGIAIAAVVYGFQVGFYPICWIIAGVRTVAHGLGVTIGFHRFLTHRSFACVSAPVMYTLVYFGGLMQDAGTWVINHLTHHAYTDMKWDPHSPKDGILHAHVGWLFWTYTPPKRFINHPILQNLFIRWEHKWHIPIVASGFIIPMIIGGLYGSWHEGVSGFLRYGLGTFLLIVGSAVFSLHATWSINSLGHIIGWGELGGRSFWTNIGAPFLFLWQLISFGEANHKDHHNFPGSARIGRVDTAWLVILFFEKLGVFTDVRRPPPQQA